MARRRRSAAKAIKAGLRRQTSAFRRQLIRHGPHIVLPLTFLLFAVFGGASGEAFGVHALLLLLASGIGAICILGMPLQEFPASLRWPGLFLAAGLGLVLVQLLPLPISVWQDLGARSVIDEGWRIFDLAPGFDQISIAPSRTVSAALYFLIPSAILLLVHRLGWAAATRFLPWVVALIGAASAILGLAQVMMPSWPELYFYVYTNRGAPVGLFANVNNHAIFLLMTLAFTAVLMSPSTSSRANADRNSGVTILAALLGGLQLVCVLAAGSVAGYLLLMPTLILCARITQSHRRAFRFSSLIPVFLVIFPAILLVAYSPLLSGLGVTVISNDGPMSRLALAETGWQIFWDHFWLGTGLGTFEPVFKTYEDPETVTLLYANHAHNEYLQWAIETGIIGLGLLLIVLAWGLRQIVRAWRLSDDPSVKLRRAAAAALLIPMLHSFVEFPLRTPATLAFASICVALLIVPYASSRRTEFLRRAIVVESAA